MTKNDIKIMGDLELEIMKISWKKGRVSVRDVLSELEKKKKIAYTTVMTVMSRLFSKGFLLRKLNDSGAYIYTPAYKDKQNFMDSVSKKAVDGLIEKFGELAVSNFINIIENSDSKEFKTWQKRLKKIK